MRRLNQSNTIPTCLAAQPIGQDWGDFSRNHNACFVATGNDLKSNQGFLCCYCESSVPDAGDGHIEHLEPRSRKPSRTYDPSNLAFSCNGDTSNVHCGHGKAGQYDSALFISPYENLPTPFFNYLQDGTIEAIDALSDANKARVAYMIFSLKLDCPSLIGKRRNHARRIIKTLGTQPTPEILDWARTYYLEPENNKLHSYQSLSGTLLL